MPEVWDTLSPQQRQALQETIARSDAGWKNADFLTFASAWKFDYADLIPRKEEWEARVQQQTGLWSRWDSEVESVRTRSPIMVPIDTHSFRGVTQKRRVLRVRVKLSVVWEEGTLWTGRAFFSLLRRGRGVRIVYWECPWEEIKAARAGKTGKEHGL